MQVIALYLAVVLIWGSTWIAITYQLGPVAEEVSVAYRFGIAAIVLFVYAIASGKRIAVPRAYYPMVIVQGFLLFSLNYILVYYGTVYITSGLVAVTFSLIVLCNAFFERVFFGTPMDRRLLLASLLGMVGIALIFWPEVTTLNLEDRTLFGLSILIVSVVTTSLGNMAAVANTRRSLPVVAVNAHSMAWGTLLSVIAALVLGREFNFSYEPGYVWSLLYLAVFGSSIAFGFYLVLIRKIGSARAAYTSVLFPIVALAISTVVEDYRWSIPAIVGLSLTMGGNWLALTRRPG